MKSLDLSKLSQDRQAISVIMTALMEAPMPAKLTVGITAYLRDALVEADKPDPVPVAPAEAPADA